MSTTDYGLGGEVKSSLCAALTTTTNGAAIDVRNYDGNIQALLNSGAGTGTTPTMDVKIQDSVDGSAGWADVSGLTFTQVTTAASIQSKVFKANKTRGFIRFVATIAGTTPSFPVSASTTGVKRY